MSDLVITIRDESVPEISIEDPVGITVQVPEDIVNVTLSAVGLPGPAGKPSLGLLIALA